MIDRRIGRIRVRRGTDAQRKSVTFEEGEFVYANDKKRLFIGDDLTIGGIPVSNRNYVVHTLGANPPTDALVGDIIHNEFTGDTFIVGKNPDESLKLILIISGAGNCCASLKTQIIDLNNRLNQMIPCLTHNE